jgi:Tfp pilus assembly protein PilX
MINVRIMTKDQRGFASFMITLITMVVITLIVIGFAAISRREQRQQLDQLMSSQAFYAAETAVEDAKHAVRVYQQANPGAAIPAKDKCTSNTASPSIYPTGAGMDVDSTTNTSYSCLKVDPTPKSLQYDSVGSSSITVPIVADGPFTQLRFTWQPVGAGGTPSIDCPSLPSAANRKFTTAANWTCQYSVLRTDVIPTNSGGGINNLTSNMLTGFLVPVGAVAPGIGIFDYSGNTDDANIVPADCDRVSYVSCTVTVRNIPSTTTASLRFSTLYRTNNLKIEAFDNSGTARNFIGSQIAVDATGKSTDVLRRIRVRLPVNAGSGGNAPTYALATNGSICKRYSANTGYFNIPSDIQDPDSNIFTGNAMCASKTDPP